MSVRFEGREISFRYPRLQRAALDRISIEVAAGELIALLGPNGCGKSTLLKILAGLFPLDRGEGQILLQGEDFLARPLSARAREVAYVSPQLRIDFPITADQLVMMGRTARGSGLLRHFRESDRESVRRAMERCLCWDLRERDLNELSSGERQRVHLARALAGGGKVLLLDEALSLMDLNHQAEIGGMLKRLVKDESYSIILVAHDVNLAAEWADRCFLMKNGRKVAFGPPRETLDQKRIEELYPGADLIVGASPVTGAPKVFFGGGRH